MERRDGQKGKERKCCKEAKEEGQVKKQTRKKEKETGLPKRDTLSRAKERDCSHIFIRICSSLEPKASDYYHPPISSHWEAN